MSSSDITIASDDAVRLLHELPVLRLLPDDVRDVVVDAFELVSYDFGNVIVSEGDDADAFYVIVSGSARVVKRGEGGDEVSLHVLRQGDFFGEIGLLDESVRVATVRAREPVHALRLERGVFRALVRRVPDVQESCARLARTRRALNVLQLRSVFAALPHEGLVRLAEGLEPVDVDAREYVVRVGDEQGPMYFVESGRLHI